MPRHSNGSALGGQKRRRRFCKMWKPRRRSFGMDEAKHFEMLLDSKFVRSYAGPSNQWIRVVHSNFAFQNAGITGPIDKQDPSGDNDWARSPQPGLQVCGQSFLGYIRYNVSMCCMFIRHNQVNKIASNQWPAHTGRPNSCWPGFTWAIATPDDQWH